MTQRSGGMGGGGAVGGGAPGPSSRPPGGAGSGRGAAQAMTGQAATAPSGTRQAAGQQSAQSRRRGGEPWRTAFICVLALAILVGAGWALLGSSLLVVRHLRIASAGQVPVAQVRAAAAVRPGTPLARLDTAAVTKRVESIPQVLSAHVTRSWPDTVVITVTARVAELAVASGSQFELVDVHGVVVRTVPARPAGLPLLRSAPVPLRGSPRVRAAALVLRELPAGLRNRVLSVGSANGAVTLHLRGKITVRWGGTDRTRAKARELAALLRTGARYYDVSAPQDAVTAP
ncbi:MAG TPA: FtsQ-type POTRA domain-containing protein [Streptosporangiaceae bacterium]